MPARAESLSLNQCFPAVFISTGVNRLAGGLQQSPREGCCTEQEYCCSLQHRAWQPEGGSGSFRAFRHVERRGGGRVLACGEMFTTIMTFHFAVVTKTCSFFFEPRSERCLYWKLGAADCVPQWNRVLTRARPGLQFQPQGCVFSENNAVCHTPV